MTSTEVWPWNKKLNEWYESEPDFADVVRQFDTVYVDGENGSIAGIVLKRYVNALGEDSEEQRKVESFVIEIPSIEGVREKKTKQYYVDDLNYPHDKDRNFLKICDEVEFNDLHNEAYKRGRGWIVAIQDNFIVQVQIFGQKKPICVQCKLGRTKFAKIPKFRSHQAVFGKYYKIVDFGRVLDVGANCLKVQYFDETIFVPDDEITPAFQAYGHGVKVNLYSGNDKDPIDTTRYIINNYSPIIDMYELNPELNGNSSTVYAFTGDIATPMSTNELPQFNKSMANFQLFLKQNMGILKDFESNTRSRHTNLNDKAHIDAAQLFKDWLVCLNNLKPEGKKSGPKFMLNPLILGDEEWGQYMHRRSHKGTEIMV